MDLYGYETGFNMFSIMFFIVFALIVGTIIINAIKGMSEWSNNNKQPILDALPLSASLVDTAITNELLFLK